MEAADEESPLLSHRCLRPQPQDEYSRYTSDGTVDVNRQPALKHSTGNWRACFFILGAEFSECLCFAAVAKNLVTYLTSHHGAPREQRRRREERLHLGRQLLPHADTRLVSEVTVQKILCSISETFSLTMCQGMFIMTSSPALPRLLPRSSDESGGVHRAAVYLGLYLVALGTGGIKPCATALGADQFDGADPAERVAKGSFFNWYYFSINIGSLLSATLLVWVQDNIGWTVGYAIPTVLIGFGLAVFVSGGKIYRHKPLGVGGSPLTRVCQVVVAAARNCRLELPDDTSALHENGMAQHTRQFRFFDKAAIVLASSEKKGPWRLCTVSQVEELKMLLGCHPSGRRCSSSSRSPRRCQPR
uniref:Peptide transporter PTR1 n=1 Tax=Triticum urartu TaxID=4572 RepID=A0A8R7V8X1_TRIUA